MLTIDDVRSESLRSQLEGKGPAWAMHREGETYVLLTSMMPVDDRFNVIIGRSFYQRGGAKRTAGELLSPTTMNRMGVVDTETGELLQMSHEFELSGITDPEKRSRSLIEVQDEFRTRVIDRINEDPNAFTRGVELDDRRYEMVAERGLKAAMRLEDEMEPWGKSALGREVTRGLREVGFAGDVDTLDYLRDPEGHVAAAVEAMKSNVATRLALGAMLLLAEEERSAAIEAAARPEVKAARELIAAITDKIGSPGASNSKVWVTFARDGRSVREQCPVVMFYGIVPGKELRLHNGLKATAVESIGSLEGPKGLYGAEESPICPEDVVKIEYRGKTVWEAPADYAAERTATREVAVEVYRLEENPVPITGNGEVDIKKVSAEEIDPAGASLLAGPVKVTVGAHEHGGAAAAKALDEILRGHTEGDYISLKTGDMLAIEGETYIVAARRLMGSRDWGQLRVKQLDMDIAAEVEAIEEARPYEVAGLDEVAAEKSHEAETVNSRGSRSSLGHGDQEI